MRLPVSRPIAKLLASAAMAGTIGLSGGAATMAQDATPVGTPIGPECFAPGLMVAGATPDVGQVAGATPVGEADELPSGTEVEDETIISEATAVIENLYDCYNEGDGEAFVSLFTENGLQEAFGDSDPMEIAEQIEAKSAMAQAGDIDVHAVIAFPDGSIGIDYQVPVGKQVLHHTDVLTEVGGSWLIDNRTMELPETDLDSTTAGVATTIDDGVVVIEVSPSPLLNQPAIKLQFTNETGSAMDVVVVEGNDPVSVTTADLTQLPEDVTFIGETYVEVGEIVDTLFENLDEGNYVIFAETEAGETGSFLLTINPPFDPTA